MPQEHITTVLTALFAPAEAVTPQTNPIIVYGAVAVLVGVVALALWVARPNRGGLGQKPLTPRPDDADGLPWMPGGELFGEDEEPALPSPAPARAAPTYQPEPTYQPLAGAPQFGAPQFRNPSASPVPPAPSARPQARPAPPRNPWSTS